MATCCCGDVEDEHRFQNGHYHECEVEGCGCISYEWDGEEEG